MYSSNLGYIFNILSIWEKSVFSTIFVPVLRVFSRFTCRNGGFWVFFINIGHIHGRKKTTSTWHFILKILQWFSFDLKTPNPMLNRLQYMQCSHYLIKTIHHESWYCKIMKTKWKFCLVKSSGLTTSTQFRFQIWKRPSIQWVVTFRNYGNFGRKVTKSTVV